jgi:hypothetical protein
MSHNRQFHIFNFGRSRFGAGWLAVSVLWVGLANTSYAQTPADDLAAQVRQQGYRCDQPITASRDVKRSKPESAVWIVKCRNAAYTMRLTPDMAARITKLKKKSRLHSSHGKGR